MDLKEITPKFEGKDKAAFVKFSMNLKEQVEKSKKAMEAKQAQVEKERPRSKSVKRSASLKGDAKAETEKIDSSKLQQNHKGAELVEATAGVPVTTVNGAVNHQAVDLEIQ